MGKKERQKRLEIANELIKRVKDKNPKVKIVNKRKEKSIMVSEYKQ
jgi:hypothetical protein